MCPPGQVSRSAGRVDVAERHAVGIEGRQVASGMTSASSASVSARRRRSPSAEQPVRAPPAPARGGATTGSGRARPSWSRTHGVDAGRVERHQHRLEDRADERRHVAADDEDDRFVRGAKPGSDAGQRALEGDRVVDRAARRSGTGGLRVGCGDHDDLGRGRG